MPDLTAFRRDLHAHPETGFDLDRTPHLIATELERAGLEITRGIGESGVGILMRKLKAQFPDAIRCCITTSQRFERRPSTQV